MSERKMISPDTAHMSEDEMGQKHKEVPARSGGDFTFFIQTYQHAMQYRSPLGLESDWTTAQRTRFSLSFWFSLT